MKRKPITLAAIIVVVVMAWGLFRPELLFIDKRVSESFPSASPAIVMAAENSSPALEFSGEFHKVAHEAKGTASVYRLAGGQRLLRLTNFSTSNGPDLRVLLVAAEDATDSDTVKSAGTIELGKLKGNTGDQNYDIPAGVDLTKYRAATIWCNRFNVNFATAPLSGAAKRG